MPTAERRANLPGPPAARATPRGAPRREGEIPGGAPRAPPATRAKPAAPPPPTRARPRPPRAPAEPPRERPAHTEAADPEKGVRQGDRRREEAGGIGAARTHEKSHEGVAEMVVGRLPAGKPWIHDRQTRAAQGGPKERVVHEPLAVRVHRGVASLQCAE